MVCWVEFNVVRDRMHSEAEFIGCTYEMHSEAEFHGHTYTWKQNFIVHMIYVNMMWNYITMMYSYIILHVFM